MAFRGQHEHSLDAKDRLTIPSKLRAQLAEGVVVSASFDPCIEIHPASGFTAYAAKVESGLNPLGAKARMIRRRIHSGAQDEQLDSAGRVKVPKHLIEHGDLSGHLHDRRRRHPPRGLEPRALGRAGSRDGRRGGCRSRRARRRRLASRLRMDTLTYMPTEHVPVLASELVALTDPQPGELAVDCTFGGGGHARLVADRLGPTGRLIAIDRDPSARERFE